MIHKIVSINGVGKFVDYSSSESNYNWNGIFDKNTAIYADNGSGKTTLTQILKSLSLPKDRQSLQRRLSFGYNGEQSVKIMDEKSLHIYKQVGWNKPIKDIDVFDTFFIEENVYVISMASKMPHSEIPVLLGTSTTLLYQKIEELKKERRKQANYRRNLRNQIRKNPNSCDEFKSLIIKSSERSEQITREIKILDGKISSEVENTKLIEAINVNLQGLCPHLRLTKLNRKSNNIFVYGLKINEYEVRSDETSYSLKQTLSEGEKNALALSFFLAKLYIRQDLKNTIVIFDDPISSLDYHRRRITLNKLREVARRTSQFILLSHDINFVKDYVQNSQGVMTLKICNNGKTSYLTRFDIEKATLTGLSKDISVIDDYIKNIDSADNSPRDVVRCIRPVLEGFFRIKYYGYIKDGEWLGDFIKRIKDAKTGEMFAYPDSVLMELEDINDYSKVYHHSNPNCLEVPLNNAELLTYCKRTLDLLHML